MKRIIQLMFIFSVCVYAESPVTNVTSKYHFTTPQTPQSLNEAVTAVKAVASLSQVSADVSSATINFTGPAEAVDFAAWFLPRIDRSAGDGGASPEYKLNSGDVGRVNFLLHIEKPQDSQELLTVLRTVADVQKIFVFTPSHAVILRSKDYEVSFAEWIIEQVDQPIPAKPQAGVHEFTVGGPDFRGTGHGARINSLASLTSPIQMQELITVLRTVGDIQKVFVLSTRHALVLRGGDTDLRRAEWIIQQLDAPAAQPPGNRTFSAPSGDDVTRVFPLGNVTPQWLKTAVDSLRSEDKIKKVFTTTAPANIVVRGTSDQIATAATWITNHNALTE